MQAIESSMDIRKVSSCWHVLHGGRRPTIILYQTAQARFLLGECFVEASCASQVGVKSMYHFPLSIIKTLMNKGG